MTQVPITISMSLPLTTIRELIPVVIEHDQKQEELKDLLIQYYLDNKNKQLWTIITSVMPSQALQVYLDDQEGTDYYHDLIIYLCCKCDTKFTTHEELISKLLNYDSHVEQELDDIVNSITKTNKTEPAAETATSVDNKSTIDIIKDLDDDKFNEILKGIGLKEKDFKRATKIREDMKAGKSMDMNEVMSLVNEYKNSNQLDLGKLMALFTSASAEPTANQPVKSESKSDSKPAEAPFDLGKIMSMMAPMLSNLQQPTRQQKRRGRGR